MAISQRAWPGNEPTEWALPLDPTGRPGGPAGSDRVDADGPRPGALATGTGRAEPARAMIWGLEIGGWTEREAGNLVALVHGLRPARAGWSEREIEHLRFLRSLVQTGRLDH